LNYAISDNFKLGVSGFAVLGNGYYEEYKGTEYNTIIGGSRAKLADYGIPPMVIGNDTITKTNLVRRRWLDNNFGGMIFNLTYTKDAFDVVLGGGYNEYSGKHFGEIIWSEYTQGIQKDHRYYDNTGTKTDWNLYGKANWQSTENLNVFADLQIRQIDYKVSGVDNDLRVLLVDDNMFFFNPKMGFSYEFDNQSTAYFSFALANHEPNRGDYIDAPQGVTPQHETLFDYEVGYRYGNNKWLANANFYFMQYQNQLVLTGAVNDVGGAIRQNVNDSYRAGLELEIGYKITGKLTGSVNGTFSQNKIKAFTQYVDDWYNGGQSEYELTNTNIAFSPSIIAGSIITYKTPLLSTTDELSASFISKYVGEQYFDNTQNAGRKLDAYFTNDVRLGYTLTHIGVNKLNFNFTIRNVFNSLYVSNAWSYAFEYSDAGWDPSQGDPYTQKGDKTGSFQMAGYYPQAGVNYMLGLTLDF
jgi:iron complex outermembrane receptor protein